MRKDNKGFSLVEIIVAFAIAAIAGIAIFGFMSFGTNSFKRTSNDVGLQYEQQVVVNKVKEMILESTDAISNGVTGDEKQLIVYNKKSEGGIDSYNVSKLFMVKENPTDENGNLYWVSSSFANIADVDASSLSDDDKKLLGEKVADITFDLSQIEDHKVAFTIEFLNDGKRIASKQIVSLRNTVLRSDDPTDIFETNTTIVNSFIDSVTIKKDNVPVDMVEIIKLNSQDVSVQFSAEVKGKKYSDRVYNVTWSLETPAHVAVLPSEGILVDPTSGKVTVQSSASIVGNEYILRATSIDDPSKYDVATIKITNVGRVPIAVSILWNPNITDENKERGIITDAVGFRDYNSIGCKVTYAVMNIDGTETTSTYVYDNSLCDWSFETNPQSADLFYTFDPAGDDDETHNYRGRLRASSGANGSSITLKATVKEKGANGESLVATQTINVDDIVEYIPGPKLYLTGTESKYNVRGETAFISVVWTGVVTKPLTYHWKIEPYEDDESSKWDDNVSNKKFTDLISIYQQTGSDKTQYDSSNYEAAIEVACDDLLDWNGTYKVKVTCWAEDEDGQKYFGESLDENGNVIMDAEGKPLEVPASTIVIYEPVRFILIPIEEAKINNNLTYRFVKNAKIKRNGNKGLYEGRSVREYRMVCRGLNLGTPVLNARTGDRRYSFEFNFYNESGGNVAINTSYYGVSPYAYMDSLYTGFYLNMNQYWNNGRQYDWYTDTKAKNVKRMSINVELSDGVNRVDSYTMTNGEDYMDDENMIESYRYLYEPSHKKSETE